MLNDDDNSTTDITARKVATEFKNFLKINNKTYSDNLKNTLLAGFREYYDDLNKKVIEEHQKQDLQQKNIHDKADNYDDKITFLTEKKAKNDNQIENLITSFRNSKRKALAFFKLFDFHIQKQINRKMKGIVSTMRKNNLIRKSLKAWKLMSFLESNKNFETKIKAKTELEIKNYETNLIEQQQKIHELIIKAEERLKHEQKKKIQTKLALDQVVLRGVSALNIEALKLSQSALNDVYKSEYLKEIQKNIKTMVFPETKDKLNNYTKRSDQIQSNLKVNQKVQNANK